MPLNTKIYRNGEPLAIRWGGFHVAAMALASSLDNGPEDCKLYDNPQGLFDELREKGMMDEHGNSGSQCEPIPITPSMVFQISYPTLSMTPLNEGSYTLKHSYKFVDVTDDEVLELQPGDELMAYRS